MKPKKLIRDKIALKLPSHEIEETNDKDELNRLFCLKVEEELEEIKSSNYKDVTEFADLLQVVQDFAIANGILLKDLALVKFNKFHEKGGFSNKILNTLNINNISNKIYFKQKL